MITSTSIVHVPFNGQTIEAQKIDETVRVALNPLCENLGLDFGSQLKRLKRQPWATMVIMTTVGADGRRREMTMIDRETFVMWLATIDTGRLKNQQARDVIVAYQKEAAHALDAYFTTGVAVNTHLLEARHHEAMMQVELLQAAKGLLHEDYLDAKTRIVIAREMGEAPQLDPTTRPLYTQDYLKEKNLSGKQIKSKASTFGKRLKKAYTEAHGTGPQRADLTLTNGHIIKVNAYTEADRPLFDSVWNEMNEVHA